MTTTLHGFLATIPLVLALSLPTGARAQAPSLTQASVPSAESSLQLDLIGGVAVLGAPGELGVALALGTRLALGRYTALRFDIGYGQMGWNEVVAHRWWLIPSFAAVIPMDRVRIELGFGVGLATSDEHDGIDGFLDAPFEDVWIYRLVPAARGHAVLWFELGADVDAYAQFDAGGLIIEGNDIGLRLGPNGGEIPTHAQRMWTTLTVGTSIRLH